MTVTRARLDELVPRARREAGADLPDCADTVLLEVLWHDADQAIVLVDGEGTMLRGNAAAHQVIQQVGVGWGDRITGNVAEAYYADGRTPCPPERRPLHRAVALGEAVRRETLVMRFPREETPFRMVLSALPVTLTDGSRGAVLIWHDVSDTWVSGERARAELGRLSQLLEGAPDYAIFMLDPQGLVTTWSRSAVRVFGYEEEAVIGTSFATFFTEKDRAAGVPEGILAEAAREGRAESRGLRVRADGSTFWAQGVITASAAPDGMLQGFVKVTHDVSEQKAAESSIATLNSELREVNDNLERRVAERTEELERQKADLASVVAELEAFSYSVSHDLRAPLRAMSGFARIIEQEYGDSIPPQGIVYLHRVHENATQMGSLIDALLAFSRMQRLSMSPEPLDMAALAIGSWTALAPSRQDHEIDFVVGDLPPAMGDRRLMQQVWTNLLDNAIKFTGPRPHALIEVSATESDGMVTFSVRDNGVGFDMAYVDKIGQVFQRLHRSDDFEGVGIGLALVQRIVSRHGGEFSAHGEPGHGATFGFSLRAAS